MNCERIQELILTDYMDGQMPPAEKEAVEKHLSSCAACREFAQTAAKMCVTPFYQVPDADLPEEEIWQRIKEGIEQEERPAAEAVSAVSWWQRLKDLFALPRPRFALATALAVVLIVGAFLLSPVRNARLAKTEQPAATDEVQLLAAVMDEPAVTDEDNGDYGTAIEEYFL